MKFILLMRIYIYLFAFALFLNSCSIGSMHEELLNELKNSVNDSLIDHFPTQFKLSKYSSFVYDRPNTLYPNGLRTYLMTKIDKNEIIYYKELSNTKISFSDNKVIEIDYYDHLNNPDISFLPSQEVYPLPTFNSIKEILVRNNIEIDSFDFYILELKSGLFYDKNYLPEVLEMPSNWKHGISKGYAINEDKMLLICWLYIW